VYNLNYTPIQLREYKVEEKLHLGVREEKRMNTSALTEMSTTEIPGR
jgi:hypothetical protein